MEHKNTKKIIITSVIVVAALTVTFFVCRIVFQKLFAGQQAEIITGTQLTSYMDADVLVEGTDFGEVTGFVETTVPTSFVMPDSNYSMPDGYEEIEEGTTETAVTSISVSEVTETSPSVTTTPEVTTTPLVTTPPVTTTAVVTQPIVNNSFDFNKLPSLQDRLSVNTVAHQVFYSKLSAKEQKVYDTILASALKFNAKVEFEYSLTHSDYARLLGLVYFQNPEVFWLRGLIDLSDDGKSANLYYICDKEQASSMIQFLNEKVKLIMQQIPADATTLKKLRVCHDYICTNTTFTKGGNSSQTIMGPLVDGVGQCEGYTKSFLYLCNLLEVPCLYISGMNDSGATHAWNVVQIDGIWYNIDCTWDDPIMKVFDAKNVSYQYFGVRDEDIHNKTHFSVNISQNGEDWTYFEPPACTSLKHNIDLVYGNSAKSYEEGYEVLKSEMLKAIKDDRTVVHVKFESQEVYMTAYKRLHDNKEVLNLRDEVNNTLGKKVIGSVATNGVNSCNYFAITMTYTE